MSMYKLCIITILISTITFSISYSQSNKPGSFYFKTPKCEHYLTQRERGFMPNDFNFCDHFIINLTQPILLIDPYIVTERDIGGSYDNFYNRIDSNCIYSHNYFTINFFDSGHCEIELVDEVWINGSDSKGGELPFGEERIEFGSSSSFIANYEFSKVDSVLSFSFVDSLSHFNIEYNNWPQHNEGWWNHGHFTQKTRGYLPKIIHRRFRYKLKQLDDLYSILYPIGYSEE
jgi:hypothetical protein